MFEVDFAHLLPQPGICQNHYTWVSASLFQKVLLYEIPVSIQTCKYHAVIKWVLRWRLTVIWGQK